MFKICQFWNDSDSVLYLSSFFMLKTLSETLPNLTKLRNLDYLKKSCRAVVSNFCLIWKIHHNFLVPRMIELACKIFMPIQTLDVHRVACKLASLCVPLRRFNSFPLSSQEINAQCFHINSVL